MPFWSLVIGIQGPVSSGEVLSKFARTPAAGAQFEYWRSDPQRVIVAPAVISLDVAVLLAATPADVESVCNRTEHALGDVRSDVARQAPSIRDWHPAFAFTHLLHIATEREGKILAYQEFRSLCREDPWFHEALWAPANDAIARAIVVDKIGRAEAAAAMRWRVGNSYYSFLREAYVLAILRDSGFDARTHPLADALFRVDAWVGNDVISLFIGNRQYRAGINGRKLGPEHWLSSSEPPFRFLSAELPVTHAFGVVHLPRAIDLEPLIASLLSAGKSM